jgi:hypothetical protein
LVIRLVTPPTIKLTSTRPALAGDVTVHVVMLLHVMPVAGMSPNATSVLDPTAKLLPKINTGWPPVASPVEVLSAMIVGSGP